MLDFTCIAFPDQRRRNGNC